MSKLRTLLVLVALLSLAGCGSFGGGGSGGSGSSAPAAPASRSATLAWDEASGPVVGYRVFVTRNGSADASAQQDVSSATATVSGEPGDRIRIQVAALDAEGNQGPVSEPSPEILLSDEGAVAVEESGSDPFATAGVSRRATAAPRSGGEEPYARSGEAQEPADTLLPPEAGGLLLFEADAPSLELQLARLYADGLWTELAFERPGEDWWVIGVSDLDADGHDDVLWESGDRVVAFSSTRVLADSAPRAPLVLLGRLGADEVVLTAADHDGDGRSDLLVEDAASGRRSLWWVGAGGSADVTPLDTPLGSRLAAAGDYDGDGRGDLVWRRADAGLEVHFLTGNGVEARLELSGGSAFEPVASGDMDGDGADDLLVRDASGSVGVLRMERRRAPTAWPGFVTAAPGWELAQAADLDGDGLVELVWASEAGLAVGFHGEGVADYLPIEPGAGFSLVAFAP